MNHYLDPSQPDAHYHRPTTVRSTSIPKDAATTPTHRSHDMTDTLREALLSVINLPIYRETLHGMEEGPALYEGQELYIRRSKALVALEAALAAAPQPATPGQRMIRAAEEAVAIARGEAEPASVYPAPQPAPTYEELLDKIDGLESDLDNAVETAINRGAVEWGRLNYPNHRALRGLTRAEIGEMLDAKRYDREALVEVIREALLEWQRSIRTPDWPPMPVAIADALLARGLRLPGGSDA